MKRSIRLMDRDTWLGLAPAFHDHNYRQVWDFGIACAERRRAVSEHVAVADGDEVLGLADVRIKRTPVFNAGIAYVTGGPLVRREGLESTLRLTACLQALVDRYVNEQGLVLRVLGPLGSPEWNARQTEAFEAIGFKPTIRAAAYRTLLLDIARPPDQIRKGLAQKWRNCLNRAEKSGLEVRSGTSAELFDEFCALYAQMLDRKRFEVDLHADFYARVQARLAEPERFLVTLADVQGAPAAGHVASMLGDTCVYLLGAGNEAGLKCNASYLLQWHTIQAAREHGCRWYDLGGIDPEGNPGVYHFKSGMNGSDVTSPGPFELQPRGSRRHVAIVAERVHRFTMQRCKSG